MRTWDEIRTEIMMNPDSYVGWLVEVAIATTQMRDAQKVYFSRESTFKQKNDALILSKRLEREVDARCATLWDQLNGKPVQQSLLGDG